MGEKTGTSGTAGDGTLGIAGVGLIGGSIAAAAKARGLSRRIIGFGRSSDRLQQAFRAGLIDEVATDYSAACEVDLFICCLPVDRIAESITSAARHMRPGSIVTDAGSAKHAICQAVGPTPQPRVKFVGSHPLAGSEKQGFEHADADLFQDRTCIVTPTGPGCESALPSVIAFWQGLGCDVVQMSPKEHDQILARTSHLPHVAAAAVAAGLQEGEEQFAAGGFRDVTRVAEGDPDLWASILIANREAIGTEIAAVVDRLAAFSKALAAEDAQELSRLLAFAKARREAFSRSFS